MRLSSTAFALAVSIFVTASLPLAAQQTDLLRGRALHEALNQGGLVLYFRHVKTDWSQSDAPSPVASDCKTQRNLSAEGRAQAVILGEDIRKSKIPIGAILVSEFCRTREHAQLAHGQFELRETLTEIIGYDESTRARRNAALKTLLSTRPPAGKNIIIIGHQANLRAAGGPALAEAEAIVFRPSGTSFEVIGRLLAEDWKSLADGPSQ
jgi:phosphohistidine phosphatase SixA